MGWRVSWYKADKNEPLKITIDENGYEDIDINGVMVSNNNGTEFWQELKCKNEDFQKEIKCLKEHPDCDYYSITKEGFKMIILAYRQRIIDYTKASIDLFEHPEEKEMKKHWFTEDLLEMVKRELHEWEYSYKDERSGETKYFNINLSKDKDTFGISNSWMYKYAIFDMIEIYKYFDWENDLMVVYGG